MASACASLLPKRSGLYKSLKQVSRASAASRALKLIQTLGQLNVRSPRIGEESDRQIRHHFAVWAIELDSVRLQILAERFQVPYFKANVIKCAALCRRSGCL